MEPSPDKKIPYTPSQEYRYELSEDDLSQKRFKALMKIYKEAQALIPELPISLIIFGSLAKGKKLTKEEAPFADIDFDVIYDQEAPILSTFTKKETAGLESVYKQFVREEFATKAEELELEKINFNVTPMNSQSIGKAVTELLFHFSREDLDENDKEGLKIKTRLALYFGLSVGTVVKNYRNKFLKNLIRTQGKEGAEETWDIIKVCVEDVERENDIPKEIIHQFPQTLEDAIKFYEKN